MTTHHHTTDEAGLRAELEYERRMRFEYGERHAEQVGQLRDELARTYRLEEYRALKAEQVARIHTRDNLIYATLAAVGAVLLAVFQAGVADLLLAVPAPVLLLGWTFLANDAKVDAIRRYIRDTLRPRLEAQADTGPLFGWEWQHSGPARRAGQTVANVALFVVPTLGAVGTWAVVGRTGAPAALVVVAAVELAAAAALFVAVVPLRYSRKRGRPTTRHP